MAEPSSPNNRLDSWKEIAKYLNRAEKTVSRWEKRGLPVHRVPGGQRQAVFAYKHELDAWLRDTKSYGIFVEIPSSARLDELDSGVAHVPANANMQVIAGETLETNGASITQPLIEEFPRTIDRQQHNHRSGNLPLSSSWLVRSAVIGCVVAAIATVVMIRARSGATTAARVVRFDRLTDDGRHKLNLRTDGKTLYFNEFLANGEVLASAPVSGGAVHLLATPFPNVELQDISKDGLNLLVTSFEGMERSGRPLWIVPTAGAPPRRIGDTLCQLARWSRDNAKIACTNGTAIFAMNADGSESHIVGSTPSTPWSLLWSPDGERLRVTLLNVDTNVFTPWEFAPKKAEGAALNSFVSVSLEENCCPDWSWSKSGRDFIYIRLDAERKAALLIRQPGQNIGRSIKISDVDYLAPGATDNHLYVLIANGYHGLLLKFDAKQGGFQTFLPGLVADCLAFSPDGQWMTYVVPSNKSLWRSRSDGSDAIQLSEPSMETEFSAWSPDGRQIAFMGKRQGRPWRIFIMDRDGRHLREAAHGSDSQGAPSWSRDGTMLSYGNVQCEETHNCWIRQIDVKTGMVEIIPGSNGFRTARWSPNGKFIAALQPETHELKLFERATARWKNLADGITGDNLNWSHDSRFIFVDTVEGETPVIERISVKDGTRTRLVSLAGFKNVSGQLDYWIGLTPNDSPILLQLFTTSEAYVVEWTLE